MITEALLRAGASFASWILGLFPSWEPPAWATDTTGNLKNVLEWFTGLGVWVDWNALGICIGAVVGTYLVGFLIKLTRAVVAHIPMIGGAG